MPRASPPSDRDVVLPSALLRTDAVYRGLGAGDDRIGCGLWLAAPGGDEVDVAHPYFALGWVLRGVGEYRDAAGRAWRLRPGMAYLRLPGRRHTTRFGAGYAECWIDLGVALGGMPERTALVAADRPVLAPGLDLALLRRADAGIAALRQAPVSRLPTLAIALLGLVADVIALERRNDADGDAALLDAACALLDAGAPRPRLERLAREHGLSYERLRKLFAARVGVPPGAWRARRRLERARELLLTDPRPVRAIAAALGFASASTFARRFRAHVGVPPERFRRGQPGCFRRGQRG